MKQKILALLLITPIIAGAFAVAVPQSAQALDCAILPDAICKKSETADGTKILLVWVLNILTAGVGIVAIGTLVYAGILYSSAGGSSEQISKAKKLITDVAIGIIVFAMMYFALIWLLPGAIG
ncbi:hypothetical protein EOL96_02805 [Candidatus Saccharibacteria bacterium]|nr:hypothetical protein [Candidatus Saccharibacteria bacterium]